MNSLLYGTLFWQKNQGSWAAIVLTAALLGVYATLFPGLLRTDSIAKLSESWFPLAVVAMGQAVVLLTGGIDLSVGAIVSVGSVLSATFVTGTPLAVAGGILIVLVSGALMGCVTGMFRRSAAPAAHHREPGHFVRLERPCLVHHGDARR